ncbi:hypothetical protein [Escherichia coli]|uniref:hypothetical protein n=1 Tax=Escherichia coli TaxID=562 RepID=UPI00111FFD1B|nr:hypothetical protein [Escherichia coli]EEW2435606.1 hypothetical protein [Escherichia coli]EGS3097883.1 hypothetical protein [Escherichia coli]MCP8818978.1 hypothetical protein [Escherichia coli]MCX3791181.1 hypothetical protein [Escherichia coli]MQL15795.1 hypothetical protein [Escherichia coli]
MKKYLYLTKKEWVFPWSRGGVVPLYQSSTYLSNERDGVMTPDENLIDTSTHDLEEYKNIINFGNSGGRVFFHNTILNGVYNPGTIRFERLIEDGLVLCLSNKKSSELALKLGKRACVEINDVEQLKQNLDRQIGITSLMNPCEYTDSHNRNHFLKSSLDSWQDEFRIFWPGAKSRRVAIPSGMAREVKLKLNEK